MTRTRTNDEPRTCWAEVGRWALGLGVAALSIWLLARDLDWSGVLQAFGAADYRWVAAGIAAIVGTFFTRTRRWQALLWHTRVPTRPAMTALLVGQVVNLALPMRSGDVVRAAWIAPERETGFPEALGSIAVEKVWDLLALLACGVVLLVWLPLPDWFARSTEGTALALVVGGGPSGLASTGRRPSSAGPAAFWPVSLPDGTAPFSPSCVGWPTAWRGSAVPASPGRRFSGPHSPGGWARWPTGRSSPPLASPRLPQRSSSWPP